MKCKKKLQKNNINKYKSTIYIINLFLDLYCNKKTIYIKSNYRSQCAQQFCVTQISTD